MRVGLDIDGSVLECLRAYFNMKHLVGVDEIRQSAWLKGIHLIRWGLPISFEASMEIRRSLGDDPERIRFDEEIKGKPKNVLWTRKKGPRGPWRSAQKIDEKTLLALPFWVAREVRKWRENTRSPLRR